MAFDLNKEIAALIAREGDYSDHPADRGGPTRWGVTEQVARAYGYAGDMRMLPKVKAEEIYARRYWTEPRFNLVADIFPRIAAELFDTGANMGTGVAAGFLQRALNVLNRGASDYPDIAIDQRVGPMTLEALRRYKAKRGAQGEAVLLKAIDGLQRERYIALAEQRPANEAFVYGWLANRTGDGEAGA